MKKLLTQLFDIIIIILYIIFEIVINAVLSILLGWGLALILTLTCSAVYLFANKHTAWVNWIASHEIEVWIICSCIMLLCLILNRIFGDSDNKVYDRVSEKNNNQNYSFNLDNKSITFVDSAGNYRKYGDDFIDTMGNYCRWGTGFYDYDKNYIRWGNTYKDSSGAYRHWGEDFVDGAGNWVHIK